MLAQGQKAALLPSLLTGCKYTPNTDPLAQAGFPHEDATIPIYLGFFQGQIPSGYHIPCLHSTSHQGCTALPQATKVPLTPKLTEAELTHQNPKVAFFKGKALLPVWELQTLGKSLSTC